MPSVAYTSQFDDKALAEYISMRKKDDISDATINRELGVLKNMQSYAYQNQYHHKNYSPLTKTLKLSENSRDKYIPSEQEIDTFLNILSEPYLSASLISLYHGLRRGEVCHLELPDFDFENKTISIKPKPHLNWSPKNETSARTVPIHPSMADFLFDRYKKASQIGAKFICFYDDDGRELYENVLTSMITKYKKKLKGKLNPAFNFHCLRHKFATTLINSGEPLKKISSLLGHASIKMTEQIYYHLTKQEKTNTLNKLDYSQAINKYTQNTTKNVK